MGVLYKNGISYSGNSSGKLKTLWENSAPSTAVGSFTVSNLNTLGAYDAIGLICYVSSAAYTNARPTYMLIIPIEDGVEFSMAYFTASYDHAIARAMTVNVSVGTIVFGDGINPGVAYDSNYCIPYKIMGIKY